MAKQVSCRYNACAAKEYTTSQNERKTQWVKVGTAAMFDDGSIIINIDCLPNGHWWDGMLQLFKPEARNQSLSGGYNQGASTGGYGQSYGQPSAGSGYQRAAPAATSYPGPEAPMPNTEYGDSPF